MEALSRTRRLVREYFGKCAKKTKVLDFEKQDTPENWTGPLLPGIMRDENSRFSYKGLIVIPLDAHLTSTSLHLTHCTLNLGSHLVDKIQIRRVLAILLMQLPIHLLVLRPTIPNDLALPTLQDIFGCATDLAGDCLSAFGWSTVWVHVLGCLADGVHGV